jgi:ribonuclease VapC
VIVDTSALAAIVFRETGFETILDRITLADTPAGVPATVLAELGMVLSARLNIDPRSLISRLVEQCGLEVIPFGGHHWAAAVGAAQRFGRGRHPAGLNFGDCLSYATADLAGEPLLFVGDDFAQTDIEAVLRA